MELNLDHIRALADLANEKNLAEIKVENGDECITIKTPAAFVQSAAVMSMPASGGFQLPAVAPALPSAPVAASQVASTAATAPVNSSASSAPAASAATAKGQTITAPMVGTFYRSPSPESPAFVEVGQAVTVGQPLCIIEAMKLMNELESDVAGTVVEVLVEDGQPVEYGQPLFVVA
jgi:acetyl-CoA carboxylase biotin carboxyl carrier protein